MKSFITCAILIASCAMVQSQNMFAGYHQSCLNKNHVALTFDDGPMYDTTEDLYTILQKYPNVRVTFFTLGQQLAVKELQPVVQKLFAAGHQFASHSWNHINYDKLSAEEVQESNTKTENAMQEAIGVKPAAFRPPEGMLPEPVGKSMMEKGYYITQWERDSFDWHGLDNEGKRGQAIIDNVLKGVKGGAIILMHDIHAFSVAVAPMIIEGLLAMGFQLVTVGECLGLKYYQNAPDNVVPVAKSVDTPSPNGSVVSSNNPPPSQIKINSKQKNAAFSSQIAGGWGIAASIMAVSVVGGAWMM